MFAIVKQFEFSAAHHLKYLREDHPCARQHGHNYKVRVMITGTLREPENWVRDYRDLDQFKRYLDETCDHKDLNEVFPDMQTTAERLAQKFYFWCKARWAETYSVSVSETEKTWASFKEDKRAA